MFVDWFTVVAQALNFLVLIWLLQRFLYRPILRAIDAREQRIAQTLAKAEAKQAEATTERDEFRHKNEEIGRQHAALMSQARQEAQAERQRLLAQARQEAEDLCARRMETLNNQARQLNQSIRRKTQQEVFAIARKAMADLAGADLEERLGACLISRLREMDGEARAEFAGALGSASAPLQVRSAFELPEKQRAAIKAALDEVFAADISVRFEAAPDLVGGIELVTDGHKLAWSIADYLHSLEKSLDDFLKAQGSRQNAQCQDP